MSEHRENGALIFNLLRGSLVDGHGVRTTVFLKGCPLRCRWCCNVEGQFTHNELKVTPELCNGCGKCINLCPTNAIIVDQKSSPILRVDRTLCDGCGKCADRCYREALQMFGKYYTVEEIFQIVKKDEYVYRTSNGGVTIAGGEPTYFPRFTRELMRLCQENFINVALDTCGYTTTEEGLDCLRSADLLLYDIKHMDDTEHRKLTGVSNEPILRNLKMLNDMHKDIIVRIPVIPGCNDSEQNLRATAELISGLASVERLDLIGYHNYSQKKYIQLNREYLMTVPAAEDEYMQDIKALFDEYGINTQLGG